MEAITSSSSASPLPQDVTRPYLSIKDEGIDPTEESLHALSLSELYARLELLEDTFKQEMAKIDAWLTEKRAKVDAKYTTYVSTVRAQLSEVQTHIEKAETKNAQEAASKPLLIPTPRISVNFSDNSANPAFEFQRVLEALALRGEGNFIDPEGSKEDALAAYNTIKECFTLANAGEIRFSYLNSSDLREADLSYDEWSRVSGQKQCGFYLSIIRKTPTVGLAYQAFLDAHQYVDRNVKPEDWPAKMSPQSRQVCLYLIEAMTEAVKYVKEKKVTAAANSIF